MMKAGMILTMLMTLAVMATPSDAGLVTFVGEDIQPGSGPPVRTNSDAAAAAFRASALTVAPVGTITFESAPLGAFTNLTVAPGVTMNGTDYQGNPQTIVNTSGYPLGGSNTTAGGSQYVNLNGGIITFTFGSPTQFFGVYLTGVQTNFFNDSVTFSDGTSESISLAGNGTSSSVGEIAYIGFVDAGESISSITINAGSTNFTTGEDFIGIDDVSYQLPSVVPEPSSLILCMLAAAPTCWFARSRSKLKAGRDASKGPSRTLS